MRCKIDKTENLFLLACTIHCLGSSVSVITLSMYCLNTNFGTNASVCGLETVYWTIEGSCIEISN